MVGGSFSSIYCTDYSYKVGIRTPIYDHTGVRHTSNFKASTCNHPGVKYGFESEELHDYLGKMYGFGPETSYHDIGICHGFWSESLLYDDPQVKHGLELEAALPLIYGAAAVPHNIFIDFTLRECQTHELQALAKDNDGKTCLCGKAALKFRTF